MHHRFRIYTIIFFSLFVSPLQAADTFRVAYEDSEQPPFFYGNSEKIDLDKPGIVIELISAASEQVGLHVEFKRMPWKRCLQSLKDGDVDAVFISSFVKERLEFGRYPGDGSTPDVSLRLADISYSFYRLKGTSVTWDGKTLTGVSKGIQAPSGFSIVGDLKKMGYVVIEHGTTKTNLKILNGENVSVVALQDIIADQLVRSEHYTNIEKIEPPIIKKPYYVMLSYQFVQAHPDKAQEFWKKVGELRDPITQGLITKYLN